MWVGVGNQATEYETFWWCLFSHVYTGKATVFKSTLDSLDAVLFRVTQLQNLLLGPSLQKTFFQSGVL
jgi:hypothetical protein